MLQYVPKSDDQSYRKVDLKRREKNKPFQDFQPNKPVPYPEDAVLEVRERSGKVRLVYRDNSYDPVVIRCYRPRPNEKQYWISKSAQYMTRAYITDASGMEYQIPGELPLYKGPTGEQKDSCTFVVAYEGKDLNVRGDRYFEKVYNITMV